MERRYWHGDVPVRCQLVVDRAITDRFIDGKTIYGPWAIMHPDSHQDSGCGLGMGKGQLYAKQDDGRWMKIEG